MAFDYFDGFDTYPDVNVTPQGLQALYQFAAGGIAPSIGTGRFGGQAITCQGSTGAAAYSYFGRPRTATAALAVGFAWQGVGSGAPVQWVMTLWSGGNGGAVNAGIGINASQQFFLWVGTIGNVVATAPNVIGLGAWHYLEAEYIANATTGTFTLYLDGVQVATFTGNTGTGTINFVSWGANGSIQAFLTQYFDDIYVKNTNTREGERRVQTLVPASDSQKQFTPNSGTTDYTQVRELPCDGDTTYVAGAAAGLTDLYGITSLVGSPTAISAVQVRSIFRKDDATSRTFSTVLKSVGTTVNGTTVPATTSYQHQVDIAATDPNTAAAWTAAGVNAALIGQRVVT